MLFFSVPNRNKNTHTKKKKQRVESSTSESSTVKFVGEIVRGWNSENLKLGARGREAELDQQLQKMVAETQSNTVFFWDLFWVVVLGADSANFFANLTKVLGVTYLEGKLKVKFLFHGPLAE